MPWPAWRHEGTGPVRAVEDRPRMKNLCHCGGCSGRAGVHYRDVRASEGVLWAAGAGGRERAGVGGSVGRGGGSELSIVEEFSAWSM